MTEGHEYGNSVKYNEASLFLPRGLAGAIIAKDSEPCGGKAPPEPVKNTVVEIQRGFSYTGV